MSELPQAGNAIVWLVDLRSVPDVDVQGGLSSHDFAGRATLRAPA